MGRFSKAGCCSLDVPSSLILKLMVLGKLSAYFGFLLTSVLISLYLVYILDFICGSRLEDFD